MKHNVTDELLPLTPKLSRASNMSFASGGNVYIAAASARLIRTCKISLRLLFASLAAGACVRCSTDPFYNPTKPLVVEHEILFVSIIKYT